MSKNYLALSTVATVSLVGILAILFYTTFVVRPREQALQKHIAVMQACNQQRLYMTWELKNSLNDVSEFAPQEEKDLINQTLDNATGYFHSSDFFDTCFEKTIEEWNLN